MLKNVPDTTIDTMALSIHCSERLPDALGRVTGLNTDGKEFLVTYRQTIDWVRKKKLAQASHRPPSACDYRVSTTQFEPANSGVIKTSRPSNIDRTYLGEAPVIAVVLDGRDE
ncbi:hypothetical protein PM082_001970 [Marasmius tenuissimus]|nr:hypothetical protein PM082_001970 [Marasmius tenuissimus]